MKNFLLSILTLATVSLFVACDDDEGDMSTDMFTVTIENVGQESSYFESGTFTNPVGQSNPAPLFPGDAYEFTVNVGPNILPGDGGARVSFVTMMVQSNDLFFAPDEGGIPLYHDNGNPIGNGAVMDVTDQVKLWDAGTEVNELTGSASQKPQQQPMAADIGMDENGVVTEITSNSDGINTLPNVSDMIRVTVQNQNSTEFIVRMENVSNGSTIATPALGMGTKAAVPISPGVFVVHTADAPFFTTGQPASMGVEDIAEDGFFEVEADRVAAETGLIIPLSPGVWAVHEDGVNPLFMSNSPDFGEGLEAIAEDGSPNMAAASLATKTGVSMSDLFNTPVGSSDPAAIGPGGSYSFSFNASPGDRLSLATMMVQSNDWFYSFPMNGIALFNGEAPVSGDLTANISLYDSGTEIDELPGIGLNQVIRQSSGDAGADDPNSNVRMVTNPPGNVPPASSVIRVTITN